MDRQEVMELLLRRAQLRVGEQMAEYVGKRMKQGAASIPVIGGDARTGRPVQRSLALRELAAESSSAAAGAS